MPRSDKGSKLNKASPQVMDPSASIGSGYSCWSTCLINRVIVDWQHVSRKKFTCTVCRLHA